MNKNYYHNLFIAVSTGQPMANLPPILQYASEKEQSTDHVVWIESPKARQSGWSKGPQAILKQRGISSSTIKVDNLMSPSEVHKSFLTALAKYPSSNVYVILNGGQKLTPLGLRITESEIPSAVPGRTLRYLYGEAHIARLIEYPSLETDSIPEFRKYHAPKMLNITQLAKLTGYQIEGKYAYWRPYEKEPVNCQEAPSNRGFKFEKKIFEGVIGFLKENNGLAEIVKEVVWGGSIKPLHERNDAGDIDVAILLVNGVVIHLECKYQKKRVKRKERNSRKKVLNDLAGNMAQLYIVYPPLNKKPTQFLDKMLYDILIEFHPSRYSSEPILPGGSPRKRVPIRSERIR